MAFRVTTREANAGDLRGEVYHLADDAGTARAEVWPFMGFNCLRWQVRGTDGSWGDLLYCAPDWESNPVPTRSGHPILFPFPNRLRDGRFDFEGKTYQLPLNDSTGRHAIHGFTPRNPWRVLEARADAGHALVTGEFHLSRDLPAELAYWPSDFILRVSYLLTHTSLRVVAEVDCPGPGALPFGLGYHPYFCHPGAADTQSDELVLYTTARNYWEAMDGLPTGHRLSIPPELDFRTPRVVGATVLDTLYAELSPDSEEDFAPVAWLGHRTAAGRLAVLAPPVFRELLLFTPPHRKAVAIEPYTCASDAGNLTSRQIDAGWAVLGPGAHFESTVEYCWEPSAP